MLTDGRGDANAGSVRQPYGLSTHVLGAALVLAGAIASMPAQAQSTATPTPPVREVSFTVLALDPVAAAASIQYTRQRIFRREVQPVAWRLW